MLYAMYSAKDKPKINYPKQKGKKRLAPDVEIAQKKQDSYNCP